jgi:transcription elongation factor SPT6
VEKAPGEKEKRPKKIKKKVMKKSIFDIYEPSELKRGHFTDLDNEIRKTDIPERMQLREVPVTPVAEGSNELEEEAEWIYKQAFCKSSVSDQDPPGSQKVAAIVTPATATTTDDDWDKATKTAPAPSNDIVDEDDWDTPAPAAPDSSVAPKPSVDEDNWDAVDEDNWDEDAPKKAVDKPAVKATELAQTLQPGRKPATAIGKIKQALDFMRNQQLEVPFIAFYRKEYVQPELNINDLWKVYKYDARWCQLLIRKKSLLALFEKMRSYQTEKIMKNIDAPIPDEVRVVRDEDFDRLKNVQTPEELKDVHNHFLLYYAHEIPAMQESYKKRERQRIREEKQAARKRQLLENTGGRAEDGNDVTPPAEEEVEIVDDEEVEEQPEENLKYTRDSGPYAMCRKAGICGIAKKFGLKPEQFAENLRDNYQRHEVEQEPIEPIELAKQYVSAKFSTPEEVLEAAKFMVARQLAREPLLRKSIREIFYERAKIGVQPTKRGTKEIDENHPCYGMKYIKMKPVRELAGDQFLKLIIAEQDKLLTITIIEKFEGNTSNNYLEEIKQLYQKDEFSKSVQDWNKLRAECVEVAASKMVLPDLRKELHSILLAEAKDAVMKACCRKLYNWIKVAPYSVTFPEEDEYEWETSRGGACRIMGVGYVPDYTQSAFCAIVNVDGEVTDYLRLPHLMKRKNSNRADEKLLKESDLLSIQNFIRAKKPHVVVIGGESREATMIQQDISDCIKLLRDEEQFPDIQVEIADNELAKIYSNSNKGESDFREYPTVLRQAISVARRLQDPLVEYSQLCTADEEILCLRYHTLQDQLNKEELLENLYLEFINRTNEVGVDVNLAVQNPLTVNLVQFICGLGPRKGAALIKILKQTNQRIENRTQLVTSCHMGPKVFINCSGFIKIDTNSLGDSTEAYVEVLDGSRVHPETYEWARKMAVDALEYEDEEDANPAGALEEILESPERLKDLDLDAFAVELERQGFGNKSITLYDIRAELNSRYKDLRTSYRSPNSEELFDMLTKETPESFYVGRMVLASVVGISHRKPQGEQLDQANPVRNDESGLWQCPFCMVNDFPELSEVWNHFDAGACPGQVNINYKNKW